MATRNVVPRADGEGNIGTGPKKWLKGWFASLHTQGVTDGTVSASVADLADAVAKRHTDFAGVIEMYGGPNAPDGWLLCDGASYLRTNYAALYAVIGSAFGTADGTHFNVPDMKNAFPRGTGTSTIFTDNTYGSRAASKGGGAATGIGSQQNDSSQGHKHEWKEYENTHAAGVGRLAFTRNSDAPNGFQSVLTNVFATTNDGINGVPRTALETRGKNIEVNFIIKT